MASCSEQLLGSVTPCCVVVTKIVACAAAFCGVKSASMRKAAMGQPRRNRRQPQTWTEFTESVRESKLRGCIMAGSPVRASRGDGEVHDAFNKWAVPHSIADGCRGA